jgi:hypothetical protein
VTTPRDIAKPLTGVKTRDVLNTYSLNLERRDFGVKMTPRTQLLLATAAAILTLANGAHADDATAPEITAQGFDIQEPRAGVLGEFDRIRL